MSDYGHSVSAGVDSGISGVRYNYKLQNIRISCVSILVVGIQSETNSRGGRELFNKE